MAIQTPYQLLQNSMSRPLLGKLVVKTTRCISFKVTRFPFSSGSLKMHEQLRYLTSATLLPAVVLLDNYFHTLDC
jgi:hypothetical protein